MGYKSYVLSNGSPPEKVNLSAKGVFLKYSSIF